MNTKKIISWKKHSGECGFRAITDNGENIFIEDYHSKLQIEINDELEDLIIEPIEFGKDYQFDVPEEMKDHNKLDYSYVNECKIKGNTRTIQALLYSIGWSNENNFHRYKEPLIEDLKYEMQWLKNSVEELSQLLQNKKRKK